MYCKQQQRGGALILPLTQATRRQFVRGGYGGRAGGNGLTLLLSPSGRLGGLLYHGCGYVRGGNQN